MYRSLALVIIILLLQGCSNRIHMSPTLSLTGEINRHNAALFSIPYYKSEPSSMTVNVNITQDKADTLRIRLYNRNEMRQYIGETRIPVPENWNIAEIRERHYYDNGLLDYIELTLYMYPTQKKYFRYKKIKLRSGEGMNDPFRFYGDKKPFTIDPTIGYVKHENKPLGRTNDED